MPWVLPRLHNFPLPLECPSEESKSQLEGLRFHLYDLSFKKKLCHREEGKSAPNKANSPLWLLLAGKENSA